jgi:SAM-dependent methyltransferase
LLPFSYKKVLARELRDCDSVLDLGCGETSPIRFLSFKYKVGVDLHKPYLLLNKQRYARAFYDDYVLANLTKLSFAEGCFDVVVALDVIEHLPKLKGFKLIQDMIVWAKKKVVVFTPNGFVVQNEDPRNKLQLHKSGWNTKDFERLGFKVYGINGWRFLRGEGARVRFSPKTFWGDFSALTQVVTYFSPQKAFQLFCIKSVKEKTPWKALQG